MSWLGKGKFIGTDRDNNLDRNINNAYGVWSLSDVSNYTKNLRWAFPSTAIAATGGSISTVTVNNQQYRVHEFTSPGNFIILSSSVEPITIECTGSGGVAGSDYWFSINTPGCSSSGGYGGGSGAGARVVIGTGFVFSAGSNTVYVGDPVYGSSVFDSSNNQIILSGNGQKGGNAPPGGAGGGGVGSAGTSFAKAGIAYSTFVGGNGGPGYYYNGCEGGLQYGGAAGGTPGYNTFIPQIPSFPNIFPGYVAGPLVPSNRNRGLGNPAGYGPDINFVPGGGNRGGIIRIMYKLIQ